MQEIRQALLVINGHSKELEMSVALALLDGIARNPASAIEPRLRHFLQNRSYQKALALIEGGALGEHGRCGGH